MRGTAISGSTAMKAQTVATNESAKGSKRPAYREAWDVQDRPQRLERRRPGPEGAGLVVLGAEMIA